MKKEIIDETLRSKKHQQNIYRKIKKCNKKNEFNKETKEKETKHCKN